MSDKQREKHLAAYWNGPVTRAEVQKVFDETANVIKSHHEIITKLDMVLAFVVEKCGATTEEVQAWINERMKKAQAAANPPSDPVAAEAQQPAIVSLD